MKKSEIQGSIISKFIDEKSLELIKNAFSSFAMETFYVVKILYIELF